MTSGDRGRQRQTEGDSAGGWERTREEVEEVREVNRREVHRVRQIQMPAAGVSFRDVFNTYWFLTFVRILNKRPLSSSKQQKDAFIMRDRPALRGVRAERAFKSIDDKSTGSDRYRCPTHPSLGGVMVIGVGPPCW